ncbi:hypothetical protein MRX96_045036 [Rhipicephalus microplus]
MLHVRMLYGKIQPTGKWSEPVLLQVAPTQDFSTKRGRHHARSSASSFVHRWLLGRLKPSLCTGAELSSSCKRREKVSPRRVNTLVDERGLRHELRLRTPDEAVRAFSRATSAFRTQPVNGDENPARLSLAVPR